MDPIRRWFEAMGTRVELIAAPGSKPRDVARAFAFVRGVFEREEARFSRFRTDSELSLVNSQAGRWVQVSRPFASLTDLALRSAEETGGLFDPTVLPALKAAGYDRDYAEVRARADAEIGEDAELAAIRRDFRTLMIKNSTACGAWRDIELEGDRLRMPRGAELDFGGIAKGWTVDLAAEKASELPWAIVDGGGDLRIVGDTPEEGLDVAVEDPEAVGLEAMRLRLASGALATTSVTVRSWGPGAHHIIDPRTSLPALTGVVQATVWGANCAEAEVWSKAAVLAGPGILDRVSASIVLESGEIVTNFVDSSAVEEPRLSEVVA